VKHRRSGLIAAASVVLGAAAGYITNIITSRWSWTLLAALVVVVAVAAALAFFGSTTSPARPGAQVSARRGSRIIGGSTSGKRGTRAQTIAIRNSTISNSDVEAKGSDAQLTAKSNSEIRDHKAVGEP
jgi:hypothetical protein